MTCRFYQKKLNLLFLLDEDLNRRTANLTNVYTEVLNRKVQEEVDQYCSETPEGKRNIVRCVALGAENT